MAFVFIYGLFIHTLMFRIIIASQSRNIGTQFQKVEIGPKMTKMAKSRLRHSSFGVCNGPRKFEVILGKSSFFPVVWHGIAL